MESPLDKILLRLTEMTSDEVVAATDYRSDESTMDSEDFPIEGHKICFD